MSLNGAAKGDRLVVINDKSPFFNRTVVVQAVLAAQDYRKVSREGEYYKVYKCTDKDMNVCMLSPTEVRRADDDKRPMNFRMQPLTPLGKMRISTRPFRKNAGSDDQTSDEWGLLVAIFNQKGDFLGLKVGCQYIEKDAIQEILDRIGEIGYPMGSTDSMESVKE